jgi:ubiquinone/menaquinone biosynthesis C-methylase UbiE
MNREELDFKRYNRDATKKKYDEFYKKKDFIRFPISEKYFIKSLISRFNIKPGSKIMDIGCGTGKYTFLFTQFGMDCLGVDISKEGVKRARERSPRSKFMVGDVTNMNFIDNSFDVLYCSGLSLFNETDLSVLTPFTTYLLKFLKDDGLFIFIKTSKLTDKFSKNNSRLDYSIESFMSFFNNIDELSPIAVTGTYPQIFPVFRDSGFSNLLTGISIINTKLTGIGLRISIVLRKASHFDKK